MPRSSKRGGALAAVLLSFAAIAVVAVVALVATGFFIARNVRVTDRGRGGTRIETPFGSLQVREGQGFDPKLAGIPVYPGAQLRRQHGDKQARVELDFGGAHQEFAVAAAEYVTSDPVSKVVEYYQSALPDWSVSKSHRHGSVQIQCGEVHSKKVVAIKQRGGDTVIALASIGEPASN